jgi:hypothetical protein
MAVSVVTDSLYAYRFVQLLVTPFNRTEAYKLGLIDEKGKRTDKQITNMQERSAFTFFHRLVFNLKRLLGAVPGGRTRIASYAAALALLREHYDINPDMALAEMKLSKDDTKQIQLMVEQYDPFKDKKKKKKKKVEKEEYGTSTADVATIPTPMKFKAFLRRKKDN